MASAARRAAAKRIEFLLSTFLLITTGELIALPPLIVRVTIPLVLLLCLRSSSIAYSLRSSYIVINDAYHVILSRTFLRRRLSMRVSRQEAYADGERIVEV